MNSETISHIGIAVIATIILLTCWGEGGWIFNAGLVWAGMSIGFLVTVYLNQEDDGCQ